MNTELNNLQRTYSHAGRLQRDFSKATAPPSPSHIAANGDYFKNFHATVVFLLPFDSVLHLRLRQACVCDVGRDVCVCVTSSYSARD